MVFEQKIALLKVHHSSELVSLHSGKQYISDHMLSFVSSNRLHIELHPKGLGVLQMEYIYFLCIIDLLVLDLVLQQESLSIWCWVQSKTVRHSVNQLLRYLLKDRATFTNTMALSISIKSHKSKYISGYEHFLTWNPNMASQNMQLYAWVLLVECIILHKKNICNADLGLVDLLVKLMHTFAHFKWLIFKMIIA